MPAVIDEEQDPFLDPEFAPLYNRTEQGEPLAEELSKIAEEFPEYAPTPEEIERADGETPETPAPVVETPPAAPPADEPEVIDLGEGASVTIERTKKGWKAALDSGRGVENFYGHTKDELFKSLAVAKLNATKKINEQNRIIKLGKPEEQPRQQTEVSPVRPQIRQLTADEKFALKTKLADDPDLANEEWFQKRTGMSLEQLVQLAQEGRDAKAALDCESISVAFVDATPGYYVSPANFRAIVARLCKSKLNRVLGQDDDPNEWVGNLYYKNFWTVKNLTEAYEDLSEDGLLQVPPAREEVTPAVPAAPKPAAAPATPPADPRIVRQVRQPRAALGIRSREVTPAPPAAEPSIAPSADDLNKLSDKEVEELYQATVSLARQGRR